MTTTVFVPYRGISNLNALQGALGMWETVFVPYRGISNLN